jgi:hypothetical protein
LAIGPDPPDRGTKLAGGHWNRLIDFTLVDDVLIDFIALRTGFGAANKSHLSLAVLAFEGDWSTELVGLEVGGEEREGDGEERDESKNLRRTHSDGDLGG